MSKEKSNNEIESDPTDRLPSSMFEEALCQVDDHLREIDESIAAWALLSDAERLRSERDLRDWIRQKTGWPTHQVGDEIRRVMRRVALQKIAGSSSDREAARQELVEAERIEKTEGGKLRDEIEKLQRQLEAITKDAARAAAVVEAHENACRSLRECVPAFAQRLADRRRAKVNDRLVGPLRDAEDRVASLTKALDVASVWGTMDYMERANNRTHITQLDRDAIVEEVVYPEGNPRAPGSLYYRLSNDINYRRQQWEDELADAKVEAGRLRAEYDAAIDEIDAVDNWALWANDQIGVPA